MITYTETVDYRTGETATRTVGVGSTLYVRTETERVMSDVWEYVTRAYYWDTESSSLKNVCVDTDSGYRKVSYTIDGDIDNFAGLIWKNSYEYEYRYLLVRAENAANETVHKGRTVIVARGRKSRGATGKVVSVKEGYYGTVLGIALTDDKGPLTSRTGETFNWYTNVIWIAARNCDVANPVVDTAAVQAAAKSQADRYLQSIRGYCASSETVRAKNATQPAVAA